MDNIKLKENPKITGLTVSDDKKVKLSWTEVKGAEKYAVKRSVASKDGFEVIGWAKKCSYTDEDVPQNVSCFYKITAVKMLESKKKSTKNSPVRVVIVSDIPAPEELKAYGEKGEICLNWKEVKGADGYIVSKRNEFYSQMLPTAKTEVCKYTDESAVSGQPYYYCVQAYKKDADGEKQGNYSGQVSSVSLGKGAVIEAKALLGKKIYLKSRVVAGADGYILQRKDDTEGEYREVLRTESNTEISLNDTVPKSFRTYFYRILAYKTVENKLYLSEPTDEIKIKSK